MELLGRDSELRWILSYVTAAENQVNVVSRGRDGSIGSFLFSQASFVRNVQSCLASRSMPPMLLAGAPGVGRSALLQAAAQYSEQLPGLRLVQQRGGRGVEVLRHLYDGIDEVSDEELLMMPVLSNAGKTGGVVLFLDDLEVGSWLPVPLPPGVRCIIAPRSYGESGMLHPQGFACLQLLPLEGKAAQELQRRLACEIEGSTVNPLWLHLASQLGHDPRSLPKDLTELVAMTVDLLENELGDCVRQALCSIALSRVGLQPEEIIELLQNHPQATEASAKWSQLSTSLAPLLVRAETGVQLKRSLQHWAEEKMTSSERSIFHARLATFFLTSNRRVEACYHYWRMGDLERLLATMVDWSIFPILEREHRSALLDYCRAVGGYPIVRRALTKAAPSRSLWERIIVGRFLSHVGEFAAAKEILLQAKPEAAASANPCDLGQVCTLIAENEIRYWDSLRNWGSAGALKDLMDSSQTAVKIFEEELQKHDRMSTRVDYAQALSRWANGCFKVSCVINMVMAYKFLGHADEAIQKVEDLFKGCPPSKVLGRAILVRGVAKLVLGHNRQRYRLPHRDILVQAAELLTKAEDILVQAAGEVNEGSIYTHGNLGELYLHDVGHVPLALLHNTKSCLVGLKLWGAEHPNVERKLREFGAILGAVGFSSHVQAVLAGDVQALQEMLRVFTSQEHLLHIGLHEWEREEDSAALDYASRRWPPPEATVVE